MAPLAATALAQTADRPEVKVGDRWVFQTLLGAAGVKSMDRDWVVTSVTPERIEGTDNGHPLVMTRDLNPVESSQFTHTDQKLLVFPLEVGRKWSFTDDYEDRETSIKGRGTYDVTVLGYGKVQVPAGDFDAFELEASGKWLAGGFAGETHIKYWYAPAARAIVKQQVRSSGAHAVPSEIELIRLQLQP